MNCSSLSSVRVNRVAEYKNKQDWSNYKDKIKPSGKYLRLDLDCESNFEKSAFLMNEYITIDRYGRVTSDGEGKVIIMGSYELNIRVTLIIHLRITE